MQQELCYLVYCWAVWGLVLSLSSWNADRRLALVVTGNFSKVITPIWVPNRVFCGPARKPISKGEHFAVV